MADQRLVWNTGGIKPLHRASRLAASPLTSVHHQDIHRPRLLLLRGSDPQVRLDLPVDLAQNMQLSLRELERHIHSLSLGGRPVQQQAHQGDVVGSHFAPSILASSARTWETAQSQFLSAATPAQGMTRLAHPFP